MNCPQCGYPKAKYVESRKKNWGGKGKHAGFEKIEPRTNYKAKCPKCGFKWDNTPEASIIVSPPQTQVNEPSTENRESQA
jgi:predicted  nucleic acid-binding Zn-ribbon protein